MPHEKQKLLAGSIKDMLHSIEADDVSTIRAIIAGNNALRRALLIKIVEILEQQADVEVSNFDL